ncbi:MAG: ribosome small subunit-dependent GTPase A [Clostridia bacterium]|nr:ribosome small subunit-dependent GTPase A [Clostridia bacterium]
MIGKIIKGIGGFYYVKTSDGNIIECRARGVFRNQKEKPYIGDDVEITVNGESGSIEKILKRRNLLIRPPVANIDTVVIVIAAKDPEPNTLLADKLILTAEIAGIEPIICINKSDLKADTKLLETYQKAGYKSISVSAKNAEDIEGICPLIANKTSAFAGLSGVGKSTILGILTGTNQKTGEISQKIKRGRHTTRCVELLELPFGGYVLDTPGFSSFEISGIKADEIQNYFPEMQNLSGQCRFKGCSHTKEPDCAVKEAIKNGEIAKSRYESYLDFYETLKNVKDWENK